MAREKRWNHATGPESAERRTTRNTVIALLLTCATLMVLDNATGDSSPVEPVRRAVGEVVGPLEQVTTAAARPFTSVGDFFTDRDSLRAEVRELEAENAALRARAATDPFDRNRLAELEGMTRTAAETGQALVPARVVGYGAAQNFTRTVTIDAGSSSGITPDLTVVNNDGLVGRVIRVTRTTATVLLVVDSDSTVGGRISESREIGFVKGRGSLTGSTELDFELLDDEVLPAEGDAVLTWGDGGSAGNGPYTAGIPVGTVTEVYASLRDNTRRAVLKPFVDFSALDVVGVAVPSGTDSDRAVIEVDGSIG